MRLLLICAFGLCCSWASAQENELDRQYTPPSKAKFSQSKGGGASTGFFPRASEAPFLWAVKYDLTKASKSHHQLGFEMSVTDWFSIEPTLGLLTKPTDMYFREEPVIPLFWEIPLGLDRQPVTALSYGSLFEMVVPRNNSILSSGLQLNLYSNGDRSFENMAYMLQLGYQFQHMAYTLGDTVDGDAFTANSREGFIRRQQFTIFLGGQMVLGNSIPFTIEYGAVASFNFFTAPTFSSEQQAPNLPFNFTYQELEYATAMVPSIGFRLRLGMGYNP